MGFGYHIFLLFALFLNFGGGRYMHAMMQWWSEDNLKEWFLLSVYCELQGLTQVFRLAHTCAFSWQPRFCILVFS